MFYLSKFFSPFPSLQSLRLFAEVILALSKACFLHNREFTMHIHSIQLENIVQENFEDCFNLVPTLQTMGVVQHLLLLFFFPLLVTFHMK